VSSLYKVKKQKLSAVKMNIRYFFIFAFFCLLHGNSSQAMHQLPVIPFDTYGLTWETSQGGFHRVKVNLPEFCALTFITKRHEHPHNFSVGYPGRPWDLYSFFDVSWINAGHSLTIGILGSRLNSVTLEKNTITFIVDAEESSCPLLRNAIAFAATQWQRGVPLSGPLITSGEFHFWKRNRTLFSPASAILEAFGQIGSPFSWENRSCVREARDFFHKALYIMIKSQIPFWRDNSDIKNYLLFQELSISFNSALFKRDRSLETRVIDGLIDDGCVFENSDHFMLHMKGFNGLFQGSNEDLCVTYSPQIISQEVQTKLLRRDMEYTRTFVGLAFIARQLSRGEKLLISFSRIVELYEHISEHDHFTSSSGKLVNSYFILTEGSDRMDVIYRIVRCLCDGNATFKKLTVYDNELNLYFSLIESPATQKLRSRIECMYKGNRYCFPHREVNTMQIVLKKYSVFHREKQIDIVWSAKTMFPVFLPESEIEIFSGEFFDRKHRTQDVASDVYGELPT
jgi:hypothetical protein